MKTLVVYYSFDGNTEAAAQKIVKGLEADILKLQPAKEIPGEGFKKFMIGGMQALFGICPKLEPITTNVKMYDRIILGTPIWAGKCAPAINSFFKEYQIYDKVSDVFTCSGSGDHGKCISDFKKKLPNLKRSLALVDRKSQSASENEAKLAAFVEELKRDGK